MSTPSFLLTFSARMVSAAAWQRAAVLALLAAASLGLCWWLGLRELAQSVAQAAEARQAEAVRLDARVAAARQVQAQAAQAQFAHDALAEAESSLPWVSEAARVWPVVYQASRAQALRLEAFKPGPVNLDKPHPRQRANLRLSGSFEAFQAFASALSVAEKSALSLESFTLAGGASLSDGAPGKLVLDAVVLSLLRPDLPSDTGPSAQSPSNRPALQPSMQKLQELKELRELQALRPPELSGTPADPFERQRLRQPSATSSSDVGSPAAGLPVLQSAPLAQLRVVGTFRAADQAMALVHLQGVLHPVRVGDVLGTERATVLAIESSGVKLRVSKPGRPGSTQPGSHFLPLAKE